MEPDLYNSVEGIYDPVANPSGWLVYDKPLSDVLNTIVIHHSVSSPGYGPLEIQARHMFVKGYADIGYHFVIDELGQMYFGRSLTVRGAHTGGYNTGTVGILLLGNFEETLPSVEQLASLKKLSRCLVSNYGITYIAGHTDFQPDITVCPGKFLEAMLPKLASELKLKYGIAGYRGPDP